MKRFIKQHNRLIICLLLTAFSLFYTFTRFAGAFSLFASSASDLWKSILLYGKSIFPGRSSPSGSPPPNVPLPSTPGAVPEDILPSNPNQLVNRFSQFFSQFIDSENFSGYATSFLNFFNFLWLILPLVVLIIVLGKMYLNYAFTKHNNNYNQDTKQLKVFKRLSNSLYVPVKDYLSHLFDYIRQSSFPRIWLVIWLFNFNVFSVFLMLTSTALYFDVTLNFVSLYHLVYNSIAALLPMFRFVPVLVWITLVFWLIDRWRKNKALDSLRHMENMNKGFINERSLSYMNVGKMGSGKTTLITDIALSTESIHRSKAREFMIDIEMEFPNFPFIVLENDLKEAIAARCVFNTASCGEWVKSREQDFKKAVKKATRRGISMECLSKLNSPGLYWAYDFERYGLYHDDKKTLTYLFDALKDYAKLYVIYITQSSLLVSNYAIRTDFIMEDRGNMPIWNLDFFDRDSRLLDQNSRQSHILDFDMVRLGRKLVEHNKYANCFEFGVIVITEVGKERGNQFRDKEVREMVKAKGGTVLDFTSHLNDKFNDFIKLVRHPSTVRGYPFVRFIMDEQRAESLGADARGLCEVVPIGDRSETKLAMPFFFIGELIYDLMFMKFVSRYQQYRFNRGDNTLLMYLLKKLVAWIHNYRRGIYNRFGYHVRQLVIQDGETGKVIKETSYYLCDKKIYSNRFSTDAYADIFAERLKTCGIGLDNMPTYATVKATVDELESQNSYFINEILSHSKLDDGGSRK